MVLSAEVVMPHVCFFVACENKKVFGRYALDRG